MLLVGAVRSKRVVQVMVFASRPPYYCMKRRKSNPGCKSRPGKEDKPAITTRHGQKCCHSDCGPPISKVTDTDRITRSFALGFTSLRCKSFQPIEAFEMRDAKQLMFQTLCHEPWDTDRAAPTCITFRQEQMSVVIEHTQPKADVVTASSD